VTGEPPMAERSEADLVESLVTHGCIKEQEARCIAEGHPGLCDDIVFWIREAAHVGNWRRVDTFANLAAPLQVAGLGEVLQDILDSDATGVNKEDPVNISWRYSGSGRGRLSVSGSRRFRSGCSGVLALQESYRLTVRNWHARGLGAHSPDDSPVVA
jgi:hypothetical protein